MSIQRTILKPVAFLAGLHASSQVRSFLRAHRDARGFQDSLLQRMLEAHRETDFGRDHGFSRISTYREFVSAVPVGSYQTHRPYIDRLLEGHVSALLPPDQRALMFSMTSGTTGQPKYIPVTPRFAAAMGRGWNVFGLMALKAHPSAWLRPILQISSPLREMDSPTGLPCGAISGLLATTQKKIVRRMYVVPQAVAAIPDAATRYYTILRCGIGQDVSFITTANPSSTIKLIETGQQHCQRLIMDVADGRISPPGELPNAVRQELHFRPNPSLARRLDKGVSRDGCLLPRHFWNISFLANWTGGTLRLYLPRLRELFDNAPIRDIGLLASEGRFSVPLEDGTAAGVADIESNFLEFIPAEFYGQANPPALRADEVEVGREYYLVISNWTGLWRYNMDDCVRVTGKLGQSPIFEFLHRGSSTANITGEKITEHQVVEAMRHASQAAGLKVERFLLQGHFADVPYYQLSVEEVDAAGADLLARLLDEHLCRINIEYQSKRCSTRLDAVRGHILPAGSLDRREHEQIAKRRGRSEQYKHQYLLTDVISDAPVTSSCYRTPSAARPDAGRAGT